LGVGWNDIVKLKGTQMGDYYSSHVEEAMMYTNPAGLIFLIF
jgi:hypothetical protein